MYQKNLTHARDDKIKLRQIFEKLNMQESNFSHKLRHELSEQENSAIIVIIDNRVASYEKGGGNYD